MTRPVAKSLFRLACGWQRNCLLARLHRVCFGLLDQFIRIVFGEHAPLHQTIDQIDRHILRHGRAGRWRARWAGQAAAAAFPVRIVGGAGSSIGAFRATSGLGQIVDRTPPPDTARESSSREDAAVADG